MDKVAKKYLEKGIVTFTCNVVFDGKKKRFIDMPKWGDITKDNCLKHINNDHNGIIGICGLSKIAVLDVDDINHLSILLTHLNMELPEGCGIQKTPGGGLYMFFKDSN